MPSTLLKRFLRQFTSDDKDTDDTGDSGFVTSPLDRSVRYSHGGSESEANSENAKIQREAEKREGRHR